MFRKAKNFFMKKMLQRQLKDAPADQREMIMGLLDSNPKLLEKIAVEMKAEMKTGKSQTAAATKVLPKYQRELQASMTPEMREKAIKQQMGIRGRFNPSGTIRK